ncbi:MAG: hypothetical protein MZV70_15205 [Desulfobacterales bacterium]|nr:hypothetical protein [Desulfobacterales bacterium]
MMLRRAAQGHGRGALRHGRADGQPPQRLHARHGHDRDLRHARGDRRGGELLAPAGQGEGERQAARAGDRGDEQAGQVLLRQLPAGLLRPARPGGRGRHDDRDPQLPGGLRRRRLPEPALHLPAAPDDAAPDHQGLNPQTGRGLRAAPASPTR